MSSSILDAGVVTMHKHKGLQLFQNIQLVAVYMCWIVQMHANRLADHDTVNMQLVSCGRTKKELQVTPTPGAEWTCQQHMGM